MMHSNRRSVVSVLLLLAAGVGFAAYSRADAPPKAASAALSQLLVDAVRRGDAPGVVGLVVDRNGVLFEGAAGELDVAQQTPMHTDAIFNIASMTKPVTSVAIMMLVEQGKLALDDPVSKYLPGFDRLEVITAFNAADGTYQTRPATRAMTLRHLLTHTSGIGYGFSSSIVARLQQGNQKMEWELPLLSDPGERWTYSASTRVLGLIVEKVTGTSLEQYYQEHIFRPLGMVDTSFAVPPDKQARVSSVYAHADGKFQERPRGNVPATPTPPFRGDGGLYSTAHDYGQFMRMILNGGRLGGVRILGQRSVQLMEQNQIGAIFVTQQPAANPALTRPFPLGAGRDKFGLGFQITEPGTDGTKYRRPGSLSWAGIFNTEFWIDPRSGIGGVLLMQYLPFYDEGAIRTLQDFEAGVYRQLVPAR
jgi:CubicO group peptidase (beta-lactamase class C family)